MKAIVTPVYFDPGRDDEFDHQVVILDSLFHDLVEFTEPVALGSNLFDPAFRTSDRVDAVVFPQLLGEAYRQVDRFREIQLPILVITSEFGTCSMWDWEICSYLKSLGIKPITPYNQTQAQHLFRALIAKRKLANGKFLVFQDKPGEGFQASIFKRFYWWEDECIQRIKDQFHLEVVKKSYQELAANARLEPDEVADRILANHPISSQGLSKRALLSAIKLSVSIEKELDSLGNVLAAGINCLNESRFSDTTPCLAWNELFERRGLVWGCEADLISMLTEFILYSSIQKPVMMTNLYPFLMGQAALKHEKISSFPMVENPEDHILVAHCGYVGVIPASFATEWCLRPKVLEIVDENSHAIDARLPEGEVTLVKLDPSLRILSVIRGELVGYVQFPGSHCLNGGVIRVANGNQLMKDLLSHHYIIVTGDHAGDIELIASVFELDVISM